MPQSLTQVRAMREKLKSDLLAKTAPTLNIKSLTSVNAYVSYLNTISSANGGAGNEYSVETITTYKIKKL